MTIVLKTNKTVNIGDKGALQLCRHVNEYSYYGNSIQILQKKLKIKLPCSLAIVPEV